MQHNKTLLPAMILVCGFLAVAHPVSAASIPIVNAGFEDPALGDNDFTSNTIPGWTGTDAGGAHNFGVFNPTTSYFTAQAPQGLNVAYIERGAIFQRLTATLEPGEYTLTVLVGDSLLDLVSPFTVQLRAGGSVLANASTPVPANGTFTRVTVRYTATPSDPLLGKLLEIRLIDTLSDNSTEPYFDDVRLDFTPWNLPIGKISPPVGVKTSGFTGTVAVTCKNITTGQTVQFNKKSTQFVDCQAAGLVVNSEDKVSVNTTGKTAPFASHQYELLTGCGSWFACKAAAEGLGGHLVTITTKEEQAFVYSQFQGAGNFWIGLSDHIAEGTFQWVTVEPVTYTNWHTGQPDNKGGAEDCAVITSVGKWNDMNCDIALPAVIEYE